MIKEYETFRVVTKQMLESVKKDEWDRLSLISDRREALLERLMAFDDTLIPDLSERARWSDLIRQCLEMNGEMQSLIEEKMGALQKNYNVQRKCFKPITGIPEDNSRRFLSLPSVLFVDEKVRTSIAV